MLIGCLLTHSKFAFWKKIAHICGGKMVVKSSNPNVYATLFESGKNLGLFVLNLYNGKQSTNVTIYQNDVVLTTKRCTLRDNFVQFLQL